MVELALVLPVLTFLLLGIVDVSRYAYYGLLAANAARAAVQYGAQSLVTAADTNGMKTAALQDAQNLPGLTVTPSPVCEVNGVVASCSTTNAVYYVQVVATGQFQPLVKYVGIPANVTVTGNAMMRVEKQ